MLERIFEFMGLTAGTLVGLAAIFYGAAQLVAGSLGLVF